MADVIAATPFFRKTYDETLALIVEARNYMAYTDHAGRAEWSPDTRLLISQETMRITSRLTQAMAWMLAHRAVETGEMSMDEALSDRFALGAHGVCLDDRWLDDERLPEAVISLGRRSLDLFRRIDRLESMLRDERDMPAPESPPQHPRL
ncbi:DUF1465 family protein [Fodinicurvata sp. EGI_FJ10296]|uniref:DUF1465 family protein n=1 Tax=Fodinicurvata sp. EGI_FJ10296 TaxID=3231908 RepID=UPI003454C19D